jgi:hypothetical protein
MAWVLITRINDLDIFSQYNVQNTYYDSVFLVRLYVIAVRLID